MVISCSPCIGQSIKVAAGAAPTENVFEKIRVPLAKATGVQLTLISNGPIEALKELDKGTVDAASGGLTFPDWITMMEESGYRIPDKAAYKYRVIGKDIVKVITNRNVQIRQLSKEQLKAIFTGKVRNWKQIGGADQPLVLILGTKIPGTMTVFRKYIMDGEAYPAGVVTAGTAAEIKAKIMGTPGAIGLGPMSTADASVNAPAIPEVGRPITLITRGEPSPAVARMLEFIRTAGRSYTGQ